MQAEDSACRAEDETAAAQVRRVDRDTRRIRLLGAQFTRLRKRLPLRRRFVGGFAHGVISAVAAIAAYLPTHLLGLREGFWAAITAVAVAHTEFDTTRSTARDQLTGALIGGAAGLGAYLSLGPSPPTYASAVLLATLACWLVNVSSACRVAGITATIILLVPHVGPVERMAGSRVLEVGWGVCVAVATVWIVTRLNRGIGIKL